MCTSNIREGKLWSPEFPVTDDFMLKLCDRVINTHTQVLLYMYYYNVHVDEIHH